MDESRLMRAKVSTSLQPPGTVLSGRCQGGFDKEEDFSPSEASDDDDGDEPTAEDNAFLGTSPTHIHHLQVGDT